MILGQLLDAMEDGNDVRLGRMKCHSEVLPLVLVCPGAFHGAVVTLEKRCDCLLDTFADVKRNREVNEIAEGDSEHAKRDRARQVEIARFGKRSIILSVDRRQDVIDALVSEVLAPLWNGSLDKVDVLLGPS